MPTLSKEDFALDKQDVELLNTVVADFINSQKSQFSKDYLPVLSLALLKSSKTIEIYSKVIARLTRALVFWTIVLVVLTAVLAWKTFGG